MKCNHRLLRFVNLIKKCFDFQADVIYMYNFRDKYIVIRFENKYLESDAEHTKLNFCFFFSFTSSE